MQQASPQPSRGRRALAWTRAEVLPLLALVLLMLVARSSFANHYHVPSGSMQPTLQPGDRVAVDMRAYGWRLPFTTRDLVQVRDPVPGEVVVFSSPQDGTRLIKRLVAVGGDTVEVADGRLRINGEALASGPLRAVELFPGRSVPLDLRHGGGPDVALFEVPDGMGLVLGDHRGGSHDGRHFGLVPVDAFYGRAMGVYWRRGEGPVWKRL
ncbi:MAG: signal peptidase I [Luteimonas sp.]